MLWHKNNQVLKCRQIKKLEQIHLVFFSFGVNFQPIVFYKKANHHTSVYLYPTLINNDFDSFQNKAKVKKFSISNILSTKNF